METETIIVKIGGSIITYRDKYCESNYDNLERICDEIAQALYEKKMQLIIFIGAGSYGHQISYKYRLHEGYKNYDQLFALRIMANKMWENGSIVGDMFSKKGIPTYCFHNPSCIISNNADLEYVYTAAIEQCINIGVIPMIWGEINFDRKMHFTNVSGDKLAIYLAEALGAKKVIMFSDVDGVYENYGSEAQTLIARIDKTNYQCAFKEIRSSNKIDINGGMKVKLESIVRLVDTGIEGYIGNGNTPRLVYDVLTGKKAEGTYIY